MSWSRRVTRVALPAFAAVAAAFVAASCGSDGPPSVVASDAPDGYVSVFEDDFSGDRLTDGWTTCYWWQVDGGCSIATNGEQQWYRPEAVSVGGGFLALTATADPQETTDGDELPFRSGIVTTGPADNDTESVGFVFTYGYVEVRLRLPEGDGLWPAVWLLSADRTSLPEIDLLEWYGSRETVVTSHVHQEVDGERDKRRVNATLSETADGWHTVAALWEPGSVVFFLDGVETGRVDDPVLVSSTPMYLIINLALGGPAGDVDASALPQTLDVDHVRIWQRAEEGSS